jgi:hypothetical protein
MIAATLKLITDTMQPQITALNGVLMAATDRNEAVIKAIRYLGPKWLCLAWISDGAGHSELSRKGVAEAMLRVAVVRRPVLSEDRAKAATNEEDDLSLLNLWERVRGLFFRLRFGAAEFTEGGETVKFWPCLTYLTGAEPMAMGKFSITRETYEVQEQGGTTKAVKELLWAETEWKLPLALPAEPGAEPNTDAWWLCTHARP